MGRLGRSATQVLAHSTTRHEIIYIGARPNPTPWEGCAKAGGTPGCWKIKRRDGALVFHLASPWRAAGHTMPEGGPAEILLGTLTRAPKAETRESNWARREVRGALRHKLDRHAIRASCSLGMSAHISERKPYRHGGEPTETHSTFREQHPHCSHERQTRRRKSELGRLIYELCLVARPTFVSRLGASLQQPPARGVALCGRRRSTSAASSSTLINHNRKPKSRVLNYARNYAKNQAVKLNCRSRCLARLTPFAKRSPRGP